MSTANVLVLLVAMLVAAGLASAATYFWLQARNASRLKQSQRDADTILEDARSQQKEIILQGVLSIQAGNNPRVVEMQLLSFLSNKQQAAMPKAA